MVSVTRWRMFIVLFHLRRRHHHRWRNIWGIYPVRPLVRLDLVVLCLLGHHRCQVVQLGLVVLCCRLGRGRHLVRERHFDQVVRVVRFLREVQHHRELMGNRLRVDRQVLSHRPYQVDQVVRLVRVGQMDRFRHPFLGHQVGRLVRVRRVRQVDLVVRVVLVGMACMVVVALPSRSPMVGGQGRQVLREHRVCLVCRSFLGVLVDQEDQASSSCRSQPASWRWFGCAQRAQR